MKFLSTQFERTSLCGSFLESKFSPVNPISAWRIFEKGSDRLAKIHITPLSARRIFEKGSDRLAKIRITPLNVTYFVFVNVWRPPNAVDVHPTTFFVVKKSAA